MDIEDILYKAFNSERLKKYFKGLVDDAVARVELKKAGNKKWLNADEAAEYLNIKISTLNNKIQTIPHCKQGNERYFIASELDKYILSGRVTTVEDEKKRIDNNLKVRV